MPRRVDTSGVRWMGITCWLGGYGRDRIGDCGFYDPLNDAGEHPPGPPFRQVQCMAIAACPGPVHWAEVMV